jgi:hypothetical protein
LALPGAVVGEFVDDPMPAPHIPVPSHLDLTGKWERCSAEETAGVTKEQLELNAAMQTLALDDVGERDLIRQHPSPQATTSISQEYTFVHQQNAIKVQGKR